MIRQVAIVVLTLLDGATFAGGIRKNTGMVLSATSVKRELTQTAAASGVSNTQLWEPQAQVQIQRLEPVVKQLTPPPASILNVLHGTAVQSELGYIKNNGKSLYVFANHKTGTGVAVCVTKALGFSSLGSPHADGTSILSLAYLDNALVANLVRDPFAMVVSAYEYHKGCPESWTAHPCNSSVSYLGGEWQGSRAVYQRAEHGFPPGHRINMATTEADIKRALRAPASYKDAQRTHYSNTNRSRNRTFSRDDVVAENNKPTFLLPKFEPRESYCEYLQRISFKDGLLAESVRSLHRDVPYTVKSARSFRRLTTGEFDPTKQWAGFPPPQAQKGLQFCLDDIKNEDSFAAAWLVILRMSGKSNQTKPTLMNLVQKIKRFCSKKHHQGIDKLNTSAIKLYHSTLRRIDRTLLGNMLQDAAKEIGCNPTYITASFV
jgi:hypothetical protein